MAIKIKSISQTIAGKTYIYLINSQSNEIVDTISMDKSKKLEAPYRYLSSSTEDIYALISSGKIYQDSLGIQYDGIELSDIDQKYIFQHFEEYKEKINSLKISSLDKKHVLSEADSMKETGKDLFIQTDDTQTKLDMERVLQKIIIKSS